jgi:maleamate amidohydrolase
MAVWDKFLSDDDKKVMAVRKPRAANGPGKRNALLADRHAGDRLRLRQADLRAARCLFRRVWSACLEGPSHISSGSSAARAAGMPVIYSKHVFYGISGLPAADPSNNFSALNENSEIPVEVAMQPGEFLVEKQTPSCFTFTNLHMMLNNLGVDGLLVGGNSTSGCVRATCVEGMALGYKMQVIEEAVFDRIEMSHAAALFDMQFKICDVISADEALRQISESETASECRA